MWTRSFHTFHQIGWFEHLLIPRLSQSGLSFDNADSSLRKTNNVFSHHVVDADAQHLARFEVTASKQQALKLEMAVLFVIYPLIWSTSSQKVCYFAIPMEEHAWVCFSTIMFLRCSLLALWVSPAMVAHTVCWCMHSQGISVNHVLNCPVGGYLTVWHNELCWFYR